MAAYLPLILMSCCCTSCVVSPTVALYLFYAKIMAWVYGFMKKLNPLNAVKGVGKKIGKGFKKAGRGIKKVGNKIGRSGRAFKRFGRKFRVKRIRIRRPRIRFRCFSPETPIKLEDGKTVMIKNLKLGDTLINGSVVDAVMKIKNENDPYYKIYCPSLKSYIHVTGRHYVKHGAKYIQVKNLPNAKLTTKIDNVVSCLVTSDHKIPVGNMLFWDWEDNLVPTRQNVDVLLNKIRANRTIKRPSVRSKISTE
jgi:hypothetical protein